MGVQINKTGAHVLAFGIDNFVAIGFVKTANFCNIPVFNADIAFEARNPRTVKNSAVLDNRIVSSHNPCLHSRYICQLPILIMRLIWVPSAQVLIELITGTNI